MKKVLSLAMYSALSAGLALSALAQTSAAPGATTAHTASAKTKAVNTAVSATPTPQEIADAQSKGMVWVNLNSKVYHASGPYYGKTKHGKFMTKADAEKAGYKAAKEPVSGKGTAKVAKAKK